MSGADPLRIRAFAPRDEEAVVALWRACGLTRPWNDPYKDIATKLGEQPELFLVGTLGEAIVASALVGFDGHRGWSTTWPSIRRSAEPATAAPRCARPNACSPCAAARNSTCWCAAPTPR
jgi:hypothetical protein